MSARSADSEIDGEASTMSGSDKKKGITLAHDPLVHVVGDTGFEPVTAAV
jgi:hypothetical protein